MEGGFKEGEWGGREDLERGEGREGRGEEGEVMWGRGREVV